MSEFFKGSSNKSESCSVLNESVGKDSLSELV